MARQRRPHSIRRKCLSGPSIELHILYSIPKNYLIITVKFVDRVQNILHVEFTQANISELRTELSGAVRVFWLSQRDIQHQLPKRTKLSYWAIFYSSFFIEWTKDFWKIFVCLWFVISFNITIKLLIEAHVLIFFRSQKIQFLRKNHKGDPYVHERMCFYYRFYGIWI